MNSQIQIERQPDFEKRLGVRIEGLDVSFDDETSEWKVNGELHALSGATLEETVELIMSLHDEEGHVLGKTSSLFLSDTFYGFEAFVLESGAGERQVAKIKIYPKKC